MNCWVGNRRTLALSRMVAFCDMLSQNLQQEKHQTMVPMLKASSNNTSKFKTPVIDGYTIKYNILIVIYLHNQNAVHIVGKHEGNVFDDRELTFNIGEIPEDEVISGIQSALLHFGKGETSR